MDNQSKKLRLPLTTKWFEMTKAGIKTEDYREITPYWIKRLFNAKFDIDFTIDMFVEVLKNSTDSNCYLRLFGKKFEANTMTLGYPSNNDKERIIEFEHAGIEIRTGNPEWGAEKGKIYFVVKHGKRIDPEIF